MAMQISVTDAKAKLTELVRRAEAELDAQNCSARQESWLA
jgi:hypothetical protein